MENGDNNDDHDDVLMFVDADADDDFTLTPNSKRRTYSNSWASSNSKLDSGTFSKLAGITFSTLIGVLGRHLVKTIIHFLSVYRNET